jgi:hypothetical protein
MFFLDPNAAERRNFSPIALAILRKLCERSGAKVVTNSSHNYMDRFGFDLRQDMIRHGFPEEHFHSHWRTTYGSTFHGSRMSAITEWLELTKLQDSLWCCFDDLPFAEDHRLIVVKYDNGILPEDYEKALAILKIDNSGLLF